MGMGPAHGESSRPAPASLHAVWSYIRANGATFLCLNVGLGLVALYGYGKNAWVPTLLIRRHGLTQGQAGLLFGLIVGVSGTAGIVLAGQLADRLRQRGIVDANLRVALWGSALGLVFAVPFPLAPSAGWAAICLVPVTVFLSSPFGVAPAAIQQMMPNTMRAQATALYLFVINLIGMGLGPTAVAVLTEDVFRDEKAVNLSLLLVGVLSFAAAAVLLWLGLKPYRRSLDYLRSWSQVDAPR
jgi:MFS family permease